MPLAHKVGAKIRADTLQRSKTEKIRMDQIRLGIIGAGPIVEKKHLPALAEVREISVVAACRRSPDALQLLADRFRIPDRYTDYRALLDDRNIDAVLVAAGPPAQTEIVAAAAAAGKHILV